jgi:lipid-binding SYLF domain-containing protein
MKNKLAALSLAATAFALLPSCVNGPLTRSNAANSSATKIAKDSRSALATLCDQNPKARELRRKAKGVLVFPSIVKGGLMVGAQAGNGAMIRDTGVVSGFYQTTAASYGLQAGVQTFGYALFFMDDGAYRNLNRSGGWELGTSPSIVVLDKGASGSISTATLNEGTYAVFFNQRGLMGGLGLQGTKITRIYPKP